MLTYQDTIMSKLELSITEARSLDVLKSQVTTLTRFSRIIPALCADTSLELICYIFSLHFSFLWWNKKPSSGILDERHMRMCVAFIWIGLDRFVPPSYINLYISKILQRNCWWDGDWRLFCQFDIQVTHFCFSLFTLWLSGELREALSPACQSQPGKLSQ